MVLSSCIKNHYKNVFFCFFAGFQNHEMSTRHSESHRDGDVELVSSQIRLG
jgi:hypothetical protein